MAKRLTVVISQSATRHNQAADAEERLLSELMMAPGMDATLVGSLDSVQIDSTDYLCLSGTGNQTLAVVSSLSFEQVAQQWARLQLAGQVVRRGQTSPVDQRRVIYFPLPSDTASTLQELRQLLLDQAVQTVGVTMPLSKSVQIIPPDAFRRSPAQTALGQGSGLPSSPLASIPSQPLPSQASVSPLGETPAEFEPEWPDLDRLVDDLDALDL